MFRQKSPRHIFPLFHTVGEQALHLVLFSCGLFWNTDIEWSTFTFNGQSTGVQGLEIKKKIKITPQHINGESIYCKTRNVRSY